MTEEATKEEPSTESLIEKAESIAKRIEEANKKTEELLLKQEQLASKNILVGRASAGSTAPKPLSHDEEVRVRVNAMLEGTGLKI